MVVNDVESITERQREIIDKKLAEFCLACQSPDCKNGSCDEYRAYERKLYGRKAKPEALYPLQPTYEWQGETYTVKQLAEIRGITLKSMRNRLYNMPLEKAMGTPVGGGKRGAGRRAVLYELNGEKKTLKEWAATIGLTDNGLRDRLKTMTLEQALALADNPNAPGKLRYYTHDGIRDSMQGWAERLHVTKAAIHTMICRHGFEHAIAYYTKRAAKK